MLTRQEKENFLKQKDWKSISQKMQLAEQNYNDNKNTDTLATWNETLNIAQTYLGYKKDLGKQKDANKGEAHRTELTTARDRYYDEARKLLNPNPTDTAAISHILKRSSTPPTTTTEIKPEDRLDKSEHASDTSSSECISSTDGDHPPNEECKNQNTQNTSASFAAPNSTPTPRTSLLDKTQKQPSHWSNCWAACWANCCDDSPDDQNANQQSTSYQRQP